jgi:CPA2 family monovalent cation:H+ antiporter-2
VTPLLAPLALAGSTPAFFTEIAVLLVAGAAIAYVGSRLRLLPIVGFLLAGVIIGPNALGLVKDRALVDAARRWASSSSSSPSASSSRSRS